MNRTYRRNWQSVPIVVLALLLTGLAGSTRADAPRKVLVLPLEVYADQDLGFLQKGIEEMLITRLTVPGKIQPLEKTVARQARESFSGSITEALAARLGSQFDADYVLYGSLTVFGEKISTDARFFDVKANQAVVTFAKTGSSPGDVIEHINLFAAQVNDEVFGRRQAEYAPPAPPPAESRSRIHPDRLWLEESAKMEQEVVTSEDREGRIPFSIWRSRNFDGALVGIAVGDIDGDQRNEIVMADERKIWVYRFEDQNFVQVGRFDGQATDLFLAVDLADLNGNGREEIFVTNRHPETHRIKSLVLEWEGRQLNSILQDSPWFYRAVPDPVLGKVLLGQQKGTDSAWARSMYVMRWDGQGYLPGERHQVPGPFDNLYAFTYGRLLDAQEPMIVGLDDTNRLQVYNAAGQSEWASNDRYLGGASYFEYPLADLFQDSPNNPADEQRRPRAYLPQRVHVADLDRNGRAEVYLAVNDDASGRVLPRLRIFRSGHVACLGWDQMGLYPLWKSRQMPNYVADTAIADFDNDGRQELVFALVARRGVLGGSARSSLFAYKPELPGSEKSANP